MAHLSSSPRCSNLLASDEVGARGAVHELAASRATLDVRQDARIFAGHVTRAILLHAHNRARVVERLFVLARSFARAVLDGETEAIGVRRTAGEENGSGGGRNLGADEGATRRVKTKQFTVWSVDARVAQRNSPAVKLSHRTKQTRIRNLPKSSRKISSSPKRDPYEKNTQKPTWTGKQSL